ARSEERTVVATAHRADAGTYNNWRSSAEMTALLKDRMRGASAGKTMYVIPYLMCPPGSPLEKFAAGVQLTDCRPVVLHMIGIADKQTGRKYHICGGFPSASGKTNLAMMLAPDDLGDRYHVEFYGDDIAWLWVNKSDGRLYAINPEYGVFGVAKDTNESTNP